LPRGGRAGESVGDEANKQRQAAAWEKALADEAHEQHLTAKHATTLGVMALTKLKAAPKLRYGGPPPTHFSPPLTAKEVAKLDAATLDKQRRASTQEKALTDKANKQLQATSLEKALANNANEQHRVAAQDKALADEANKHCRAAARDKALADKANKQRHHESAERATTLATKVLAKDEYDKDNDYDAWQIEAYAAPFFACVDAIMAKIRAMDDGFGNWAMFGDELLVEEDNEASAPTMPPSAPPTAVSSPHHHPKSYVDAVLTTIRGSSQATSLTLAPAALPSPAVNGKLRMVCQCARPRCRVGRRHGPRAPNPQEHLLCGRRHRPQAPNKYTLNG
jgi:hypothetical protein